VWASDDERGRIDAARRAAAPREAIFSRLSSPTG